MRRGCLALFAASLVACFSPSVDTDTESNDATDGEPGTSSGPPSEPTTTEDPGSASTGSAETGFDETDTSPTGPDDAPPQFESFTVNGSDTPAEVNEGGSISLEASVSDDLGIASVEFFDGRTSLGIVDTPPYELDVLVSSADSGSHTYRAVATDTGDQSAESEGVMLSINIVGGEILFFREQLFLTVTGLGGPGLSVATTDSGRVVVNGMLADAIAGRVLAFNDDLSSLWTVNEDRLVRARPVDLGDAVLVSSWVDGTWTYDVRALDSSATEETLSFGVPSGDPVIGLLGSRAVRSGDGVILTNAPNELAAYSASLKGPTWTDSLPADAIITELDPFEDGAVLLSFNTDTPCANGSTHCLRRLDADGSTVWTAATSADAVATRSDGGVLGVARRPSGGFSLFQHGSDGQPTGPELVLDEDRSYLEVTDVADDLASGFVVTGTFEEGSNDTALAARYDADATLIWEQTEFGSASESMALSVAVLDDAMYVCGIEDPTVVGLGRHGDAFVAKLRR